jgi:transposase
MIEADMRNAIYQLHLAGMPLRQISRQFKISRGAVRAIIRQQGRMPQTPRRDKIHIDVDLLARLYQECDGWVQRMHEKLVEEEHIEVSYPTLTRLLRELGLSKRAPARCHRVPDEPGAEMQHDTTIYWIKIAGLVVRLIASLLYLRYSKRRYLKFYRVFNRFAMKCFVHEALMFWKRAARSCIIDNTNLARLRGTGSRAVIVEEMALFAERYGFVFICHEVRHANRKAGEERSFWTVETNFLPGRTFESLEDLNRQALEWATVRMDHQPMKKTGLIPAQAFEHECQYLNEVPTHTPAPYIAHERGTDQYGYVALGGNYYWVPGTERADVKVLQYADHLKIYQQRMCVAEYQLPPDGVKNARFSPEGQPPPPHMPKHRKRGSSHEEKRLRDMGPAVAAYVDYAINAPGIQRHRFLRQLFDLSRRVPKTALAQALERALRYRVLDIDALHRIAWYCLSQGEEYLLDVDVDESYRDRPEYLEGCLTDEPDLSIYDLLEPPPDDNAGYLDDEVEQANENENENQDQGQGQDQGEQPPAEGEDHDG